MARISETNYVIRYHNKMCRKYDTFCTISESIHLCSLCTCMQLPLNILKQETDLIRISSFCSFFSFKIVLLNDSRAISMRLKMSKICKNAFQFNVHTSTVHTFPFGKLRKQLVRQVEHVATLIPAKVKASLLFWKISSALKV